jgi:hypothetical protein
MKRVEKEQKGGKPGSRKASGRRPVLGSRDLLSPSDSSPVYTLLLVSSRGDKPGLSIDSLWRLGQKVKLKVDSFRDRTTNETENLVVIFLKEVGSC